VESESKISDSVHLWCPGVNDQTEVTPTMTNQFYDTVG